MDWMNLRKELKLNKIKLSKRLEKYLDAKRSVLLFSKGVILVEGMQRK